MLQYETVPVTPFQQNCSIVWCDETMKAAIIDPGGDLPVLEGCDGDGFVLQHRWQMVAFMAMWNAQTPEIEFCSTSRLL